MEHRTQRVRHNSRRRTLEVQEKRHVTPRMIRMVLGGEDSRTSLHHPQMTISSYTFRAKRAISQRVISPRETSMPKPRS
jgi:NADPH-dependent ferric siderophore reductase